MKKVAVMTDTNSGILPENVDEYGCFIQAMPIIIDGEEYFEGVNIDPETFYTRQIANAKISTSQPSINEIVDVWEALLKQGYDEIVYIPMSSGLSNSYETAANAAQQFNGKVQVVNNQRISLNMKSSVVDAVNMAKNGLDAVKIKKWLEETKFDSSIYIMVDTIKYLKRGGRVTPAAAAIAAILNIKPVLQIQGGKLDSYAKVMNVRAGKAKMLEALKNDIQNRFANFLQEGKLRISVAHTQNEANALVFAQELKDAFPNIEFEYIDPLPLSIATHIGPKSLACSVYRVY